MKDLKDPIFIAIFYDNKENIFNQCWNNTTTDICTSSSNYINIAITTGQHPVNISLHPLDHHNFPLISGGSNMVFLVCDASQNDIVTLKERLSEIKTINDKRINISIYLLFYYEEELTLSYKNFPEKNTIFIDKKVHTDTAKDIINTCIMHYQKSPKTPLQCAYFSFTPHNNQELHAVFQCLPERTRKGIFAFLKSMKSIEKTQRIKLPKPLLGEIITYYVSNNLIRVTDGKEENPVEEKQKMSWVMRIEETEQKKKWCVSC